MIRHPRAFTELWTSDDVERVLQTAHRVLDEVGLIVQSAAARAALAEAGARVERETGRVRMPPDCVVRLLDQAPATWTLRARNPARDVVIGGDHLLVAPGYGSAFVADAAGRRRPGTLEDFRAFAALAARADAIDVTGGMLVEPCDVPPPLRPLETTLALLTCSDKPCMGSVAGAEGARESLEMARIVFGDLDRNVALLALININSPLRLDARMADALVEYAKAGQAILLTPGILMGITAPVTPAGAVAQAIAELMGGAALVQAIRPGTPVMIGLGGFGSDLRSGGSGFGRPEQALATLLGAQVARRLRLPYRASGGATGAFSPDCRSGYERMLTALTAWNAGAHFSLQGAGTLDCINSMSYEQFVMDVEMWGYIRRMSDGAAADDESLAFDAIAEKPADYFGSEHTLRHFRETLHTPALAPAVSYDQWVHDGAPDVVALAKDRLHALHALPGPPPLDAAIQRALDRHAAARRAALA